MGNSEAARLFGGEDEDEWEEDARDVVSQRNILESSLIHEEHEMVEEEDHMNQYLYICRLEKSEQEMDTRNLYIPLYFRKRKQGMCHESSRVKLSYPKYEYSLRSEMIARRSRHESFSQEEVWYMIMTILNGLKQFEKKHLITVPISLDEVRLNAQGQVKINNMLSSPDTYSRARADRLYWSHRNLINFHVEQTYNLGILALQLCSQLWIPEVGEGKCSPEDISNSLFSLQYHYSDLMVTLISVMLSHPNDRPLPSQIYEVFSPFLPDIMNFRPFRFNPQAMHNSMAYSRFSSNQFESHLNRSF